MSIDEAALGIGVLRDPGSCLRLPAKAGGMIFGGRHISVDPVAQVGSFRLVQLTDYLGRNP